MKIVLMSIIVGSGLTISTALLAQSCCGGSAMKEGCTMDMAGHAGHAKHSTAAPVAVAQIAAPNGALDKTAQAVFASYIKAQAALAGDSLADALAAAGQITKALRSDSKQPFSPELLAQAVALAKSSDLAAARTAFKPLSQSLITYLKDHPMAQNPYHVAYCPMARARWLQSGTTIANPYFGKGMPTCGQFES
jgi:hypothetical protein